MNVHNLIHRNFVMLYQLHNSQQQQTEAIDLHCIQSGTFQPEEYACGLSAHGFVTWCYPVKKVTLSLGVLPSWHTFSLTSTANTIEFLGLLLSLGKHDDFHPESATMSKITSKYPR